MLAYMRHIMSQESWDMLLTSAWCKGTLAPETALVNCLHKFNHTIASRNTLVLTIQVVVVIGRGSHRNARIRKKRKKVPPIVHAKMDLSRRNLEQKRPVFLPYTQSFILKQQAIVAVGTDGHSCTRLKGKPHSQKSAAHQSCIQKWTFLGKIVSQNDQSFCHIHNHSY
jgi:hypothetical protein